MKKQFLCTTIDCDHLIDVLGPLCDVVWAEQISMDREDGDWCLRGICDEHRQKGIEHVLDEFDVKGLEFSDYVEEDYLLKNAQEEAPCLIAGRFFVMSPLYNGIIPDDKIVIVVHAVASFGSGHHATTKSCLEVISQLQVPKRPKVLDLGCGSGILAIGMSLLWGVETFASDIDIMAIQETFRNLLLNPDALSTIAVAPGFDSEEIYDNGPYDVIAANILSGPLVELAPQMSQNVKKGGFVVLSGFLENQLLGVLKAYQEAGFEALPDCKVVSESWVSMAMRKV